MSESSAMDQHSTQIPKIFYSDLTGAPIDRCISCDRNILSTGETYLIEKALKMYNGYKSFSTIFEYAMCMPCAEKMKGMISSKSMQRISQYFMENINLNSRRHLFTEPEKYQLEDWYKSCLVKGIPVEDLKECQIYAQCKGEEIIKGEFPYMVSGLALDEVVDLLSTETLDDLERFKNEVVDGPSEFQDLLKGGPKVLI